MNTRFLVQAFITAVVFRVFGLSGLGLKALKAEDSLQLLGTRFRV